MPGRKDEGQKYVESLLATLPEEKRQAVKEALTTDAALEHVGEHTMMRSDYSRSHNELQQASQAVLGYRTQLDQWYENIAAQLASGSQALQRLEQIKAGAGGDEPPAQPAAAAPPGLSQETVEKLLQDRILQTESQTLGLVSYLTSLAQAHYARYGEPLDTGRLIGEARRQSKQLPQAYDDLFKEKRQAWEEKQQKDAREKLREEIRTEITTEMRKSGHGAYPLPGADSDPMGNATLSGLSASQKKEGDGQFGVRAALDEFYAKGQNIGT